LWSWEWIFNQCRYGGGVMDSLDNTVASDLVCFADWVVLKRHGEMQSCKKQAGINVLQVLNMTQHVIID
jgi:hypothetical protein